jgi:cytochrome c biogenesis protein CcmG, thiol:disulfide interchange protein DsbE
LVRHLLLSLRIMLAVLSLIATGCAERTPQGRPPASPSRAMLLPQDRLALPEFDLARFQALLAELRGTPVVVNIWAAWCPPCRNEAPGLAKVARQFEGRVQFLGVDILDVREDAREFIKEFDWPYPHVFDPHGEIRDGLGYIGQPVTIIYDREGRRVFEWDGEITEGMLRREVRKVV